MNSVGFAVKQGPISSRDIMPQTKLSENTNGPPVSPQQLPELGRSNYEKIVFTIFIFSQFPNLTRPLQIILSSNASG